MDATFMHKINNRVLCDSDEADEQDPGDDVPHSLLRYLETSRSRAAVCQKLILEGFGDFPASHPTEDTMNFPFEVDEDTRRPNEQVVLDTGDEENNTSADARLLPLPTDTEALFTHNASVCPNNEDEQKHSMSEDEAERQKRCRAEMKEEELKRQIERDFQTQLKKMMDTEKLQQKELELMGRRAQEKLDQELLLQQEVMSDFKRGVQEERRIREEEQKRIKEEEDKRTREEEKIKIEAEEMRRKKEDERRIEEMELIKEERKREEEEKRRVERKREEEKSKIEMEKRKLKEEMRMMKDEEREKKRKREEERKEEAKKKVEKEKRKMEEDIKQKEEDRKKREEEIWKIEEEVRITEIEETKKQEEMRKNREKEDEERKKQEEMRKNNEKEEEKERKKFHAEMKKRDEKEQSPLSELRKKEEDRKTKEEPRPMEQDEKRKREDERKRKEEERRRTREDLKQEDEEGHRKAEAEIKLKEDVEGYKTYEVDNRKMEHESKTKERKHEEEEKKEQEEEEGENLEAEKELKEEEVGEHKKEVNRKSEEEITLKGKEESERRGGTNEQKVKIENTEVKQEQHDPHVKVGPTSADGAAGPASVREPTERRRLAWMKDCVSWSELSLQNRSKPRGSARSRRGPRGCAGSGGPAPLCPDALLRSTGCKSLQEVTSVTLEDLPGRGSSTLALCTRLRSLTLRRCGLRSLEGINKLPQLCHIDVQENDISFVDCENMSSLRVLRLGHNKLTSIHGLTGAERLDVLDLSHNSITRIAGLESTRRLQRLSLDHNQLISTRGLGCVYTLLHLSCSHNHLVSVEGLESSALLNTLDLSANSLAEPPSLSNQVLLRELHLDDNNISSLQDLTACWLPLMQHLSVAQNRITELPPMSDCVSLANLDLRFNCMSELQNVCESLEGCVMLREVHLSGNPLQQERGWRAAVQRAAPGLRAVDGRQTDCAPTPPAAGRVGPASGGFLAFCKAQLQQTLDLQRRHGRELSGASSSLDAVTMSCRHLDEVLQLAMDHRFAHEHGDATVAAGRGSPGESDGDNAERPETESAGKVPPGSGLWTPEESRGGGFDPVGPETGSTVSEDASSGVCSSATKRKTTSSSLEVAPVSSNQHLDLEKTAAAVVIQQLWRKYRQKCGKISSLSAANEGGREGGRGGGGRRVRDGGKPVSGPSCVNGSVDYAATVIQAFWRGFALRRRLASALDAVSHPDAGEDDDEDDEDAFEFEEVDVDEFVFDEKRWTLSFSEDSPPRGCPASEPSLKPPEPSHYILPPPPVWRPKQAWVVDSAAPTGSPETSNSTFNGSRSRSPASSSVPSGLSQRSEKILEEWGFTDSHTALLMLKRARKMKPATQRQNKRRDPSFHPAFRSCSYPLAPVEARNRPARHNWSDMNGGEAEPGLRHAERAKRPWTRAAHPDSDSESVHFLPEISSDVLNGGRVQLVADPAYAACPPRGGGPGPGDRPAARPGREHRHPRRNSRGPSSESRGLRSCFSTQKRTRLLGTLNRIPKVQDNIHVTS